MMMMMMMIMEMMWVLLDDDSKSMGKYMTSMNTIQKWRIECMSMDGSDYHDPNTGEFIQESDKQWVLKRLQMGQSQTWVRSTDLYPCHKPILVDAFRNTTIKSNQSC